MKNLQELIEDFPQIQPVKWQKFGFYSLSRGTEGYVAKGFYNPGPEGTVGSVTVEAIDTDPCHAIAKLWEELSKK